MTSAKSEQALRRDVMRSDQQSAARPNDQQSEPTTMHAMSRLSNDLEGRQSARDYVVGQDKSVDYPKLPASSPWSSQWAQLPPELPTGIAIDAQEPCGEAFEVARSIAALSATASTSVTNALVGTVEEECAVLPVAAATSSTVCRQNISDIWFGDKRVCGSSGLEVQAAIAC